MDALQGFILGLIQGLTEFLPISSSGHLLLFEKLFGLQKGNDFFNVAVHFATLVAVFIIFKDDLFEIFKKPFGKLSIMLVTATVFTGVLYVVFKGIIDDLFTTGRTLGVEFIFTGLVLWFSEGVRSRERKLEQMKYTDAAIMGIAQGIAILPAVSRSGMTLAGGLAAGLNREFALRFSFLMSVPAILLAALSDTYDIIKSGTAAMNADVLPLAAGMLAAAVSGYLAIRFMLRIFTSTSLRLFSYYVFALGLLILLDQVFFKVVF